MYFLLIYAQRAQERQSQQRNCFKHPSTMKVLSTKQFKVGGNTCTLKKTIATGTFGVTMSAKYKGNKIAVKAILPSESEEPYQVQELEINTIISSPTTKTKTKATRTTSTSVRSLFFMSHYSCCKTKVRDQFQRMGRVLFFTILLRKNKGFHHFPVG